MDELLANADADSQWLYRIVNWSLLVGGTVVAILLALHQRRNPPDRNQLTARIAGRSWDTGQVFLLLAALFLLYFLAMFSGRLFYEEHIPVARLGITLVIYSALVALTALVNRRRGGTWATSCGMGLRNLGKLAWSPVLYLAFVPLLMVASKGYHLLLEQVFHTEIVLQDVAQIVTQDLTWVQILYILMAIFVAPVYEEIMFRGVIFPYLAKRAGLAGGTVLVSVLFATMHFHLPSAVPLFLLSAALCLAYWRTGSLWTSIGMHAVFNAVSILALNIVG